MESLKEISLQQRNESPLALQQPAQQLNEAQIVQVGELMANMIAGYPHQSLELAMEVYQMAFEDLAKEYGMQMLETALRGFLTKQKFFPHPSEVREECEAMTKKANEEAVRNLPAIGCDLCKDEIARGYVFKRLPNGWRGLVPCECRLTRERAKKAIEVSA